MTPVTTQRLSGGTFVLKPQGQITVTSGSDAELVRAFHEAIENGQLQILVDLSETSYVDSSGFAALIRGWTSVQRAGGDVVLAAASPSVRKMLAMTRLMTIVKTCDTTAEGVAQLGRGEIPVG